ncbi:Pyrrolo-quinoline quinone [Opitutus terrae PB90-1]|uniref:Pyrrolo-quinoline quinone n=2 Tax=Opitutus terrae TaxID=107709 RepID=B1ZUU2_OPITP|nr:Pyrrolo-quinoline quinone [Opitutus terrae PB90-1]
MLDERRHVGAAHERTPRKAVRGIRFANRARTALNGAMALALRFLLFVCGCAGLALAAPADVATPVFEGVWTGEIIAPNTRTEFGLAFTSTSDGVLVSVHFPAMFLHSANFGAADIHGSAFTLRPLDLSLSLADDRLTGTFGPAKLRVELRRGGEFTPPPPEPVYPAAPAPTWTRKLDAGVWASPAGFAEFVYVAAIDGKVHALRATDGSEVWTWTGSRALYGAPLATQDSVYVLDAHAELVALSRLDGTLRWRTPLLPAGASLPENPTFNHRAAAPVIDTKGVLYVGSPDGGVHAIRARNGRPIWRYDARAPIYAPLGLDGNDLLVGTFDGTVITLDRRSRRESMRTTLGGAVVSTPVVIGDRIVVGARDYLLYGLDRSGRVAWRNTFWFSWVESTPRVVDGILYLGGSDYRRVSALDPRTGEQKWATDVGGLSWGTPVVSGGTVFAATAGQNIAGTVLKHIGAIVALNRQTGAPLWRHVVPDGPRGGFSGFTGSLLLTEGKLIGAAVDGTLLAFSVGATAPALPAQPSRSASR